MNVYMNLLALYIEWNLIIVKLIISTHFHSTHELVRTHIYPNPPLHIQLHSCTRTHKELVIESIRRDDGA